MQANADKRESANKPQLIEVADVCAMLGIKRMTLKRLRDKGEFPEPYVELRRGPLWDEAVIKQWLTSHT